MKSREIKSSQAGPVNCWTRDLGDQVSAHCISPKTSICKYIVFFLPFEPPSPATHYFRLWKTMVIKSKTYVNN